MDCLLLVNYIDCCNTEKSTLKFRELSRELSAARRVSSVTRYLEGRAIFAAIKRKRVTGLICSMTQFVFYLAIYRMSAGEWAAVKRPWNIKRRAMARAFLRIHRDLFERVATSLLTASRYCPLVCRTLFANINDRASAWLPFWHWKITASAEVAPPTRVILANERPDSLAGRDGRFGRSWRACVFFSPCLIFQPKCRIAAMPQIRPVIWSAIVSERAYGRWVVHVVVNRAISRDMRTLAYTYVHIQANAYRSLVSGHLTFLPVHISTTWNCDDRRTMTCKLNQVNVRYRTRIFN